MLVPLLALALNAAAPNPAPKDLTADQAFAQGVAFVRNADFESAIPYLQRAVKATPDADKPAKAKREMVLGLAFLNIGNKKLATQSFKAALRADPTASLPDDAPPAATPLFENAKADVAREPPPEVAKPMPSPEAPRPDVPRPDVPAARPPPADDDHPELAEVPEVESTSRGPLVPGWTTPVAGGLSAGLGVAAITLKLLSNSSFDSAESDATATQAIADSRRGDSQQHLARGLAVACAGTAAATLVLYLLTKE